MLFSTEIQFRQKWLYFALLVSSSALFFIALGPGLISKGIAENHSWHYQFFHLICHQNPLRSYSLHGQQMAVCSRCMGIYSSFAIIVCLMPILSRFFNVISSAILKLILVAIELNFLDVLGNSLGVWSNTLESRLLLGTLFGGFLAFFLMNEFFKQKNKMEKNYG